MEFEDGAVVFFDMNDDLIRPKPCLAGVRLGGEGNGLRSPLRFGCAGIVPLVRSKRETRR